MPFEEESGDIPQKKEIKKVSSQKSIFESKKADAAPSQKSFEEKVQQIAEKNNNYKTRAADLAVQYKKVFLDKTLPQNRNVFSEEIEKEVLTKMVNLAIEINNDPDEDEGMGSLGWITLLLKCQFHLRDRLNELEYKNLQIKKELAELKKTSKVDADKKDA